MSDLTAKANELLRRLNADVFNDSIDITKLPYAVGLVIDFAKDYAMDIQRVSKVSKEFLYAPGHCCGDAHQLLESHRAHMQLIGLEEVRKEDEHYVEITLHNRRAEKAEQEVERLRKEGERVDADADKWIGRAAKAEAQLDHIDEILSRRSALDDKPTLIDKILWLLVSVKRAEAESRELRSRVSVLEEKLADIKAESRYE